MLTRDIPTLHDHFDPLTEKQTKAARLVAMGSSWRAAARLSGYGDSDTSAKALRHNPKVQAMVVVEREKFQRENEMTRQKVMDGFLEAILMAKTMSDPHAMIKGWSEIGKLCGFYAPEIKNINISLSAKRVIDKLEVMKDEDLLRLAEKDITDAYVIEPGDGSSESTEQLASPAGDGGTGPGPEIPSFIHEEDIPSV